MANAASAAPTPADQFFEDNGFTQTEVAGWFGVEPSTISRKLNGSRRWTEDEIKVLLTRASKRLGRAITFEEMFLGKRRRPAESR